MCLGVPGCVVEIVDAERKLGVVETAGQRATVNLACVAPDDAPIDTLVGAWVLTHMGMAMHRVDADEAARTLELLRELAAVQQGSTR